jgi:hypothetical protein
MESHACEFEGLGDRLLKMRERGQKRLSYWVEIV